MIFFASSATWHLMKSLLKDPTYYPFLQQYLTSTHSVTWYSFISSAKFIHHKVWQSSRTEATTMEAQTARRRINTIAAHFAPIDDVSATHVLPMVSFPLFFANPLFGSWENLIRKQQELIPPIGFSWFGLMGISSFLVPLYVYKFRSQFPFWWEIYKLVMTLTVWIVLFFMYSILFAIKRKANQWVNSNEHEFHN